MQAIYIVAEEKVELDEVRHRGFTLDSITPKEFVHLLRDKSHPLFADHIILYGTERFFELVLEDDQYLTQIYSPLVSA